MTVVLTHLFKLLSFFPLILAWALQQCSATALPVIPNGAESNERDVIETMNVTSWAIHYHSLHGYESYWA